MYKFDVLNYSKLKTYCEYFDTGVSSDLWRWGRFTKECGKEDEVTDSVR